MGSMVNVLSLLDLDHYNFSALEILKCHFRLRAILFDRSYYLKFLYKYYLFYYDLFYH
jgi:hypothetical protein